MLTFLKQYRTALLLLGLTVLTFLVYYPGLYGDFIFDDEINIVQNPNVLITDLNLSSLKQAWDSGISASFGGRSLPMLSFGLNHYLAGLEPALYKLTNILLHLLCVLAVFRFCKSLFLLRPDHTSNSLFSPTQLSLLVAALWALQPLLTSSVLYVVQRMTIMSCLFTVLALTCYCRFRVAGSFTTRSLVLFLCKFWSLTVLAVLSKETGFLTALFAGVIELTLLRHVHQSSQQQLFAKCFVAITLAAPAALGLIYVVLRADTFLGAYDLRDFSMYERLLTESRVIWTYIKWILLPNPADYVFYYDHFTVSRGLLSPPATVVAALGILALIAAPLVLGGSLTWLGFGIGFFLAGHALESTIFPLELVFEHRNYLPSLGLLLGLVATVSFAPLLQTYRSLTLVFALLFLLLQAQGTFSQARKWASTPELLLAISPNAKASSRVQNELGLLYLRTGYRLNDPQYYELAKEAFVSSFDLDQELYYPLGNLIITYNYADQDIPASYIEQFGRHIRESPITNTALLTLLNINRCYMSLTCTHNPEVLPVAYQALAANETLAVERRQGLLNEMGSDTLNAYGRVEDALAIYRYAESLSRELTLIDIRIILLESARENYEAALEHIEKAKAKQGLGSALQQQVLELEQQLMAHMSEQ